MNFEHFLAQSVDKKNTTEYNTVVDDEV